MRGSPDTLSWHARLSRQGWNDHSHFAPLLIVLTGKQHYSPCSDYCANHQGKTSFRSPNSPPPPLRRHPFPTNGLWWHDWTKDIRLGLSSNWEPRAPNTITIYINNLMWAPGATRLHPPCWHFGRAPPWGSCPMGPTSNARSALSQLLPYGPSTRAATAPAQHQTNNYKNTYLNV
jgi:hypothetical protein